MEQAEGSSGRDLIKAYNICEVDMMKYQVVIEHDEEGFAVSVPGLPGCHSQGATESEALENIEAAIREYLSVVAEISRGKTVREVAVEV